MENIIQKALFQLGIEQDENVLEKVNIIYTSTLQKALSCYRWNFATYTEELKDRQEEINNKYKYSYILPKDFLILIDIFADKQENCLIREYDLKDKLYTNNKNIYLKYIKKLEENNLPSYFTDYLEILLACELCYNLTGDVELLQICEAKKQEKFNIAKNIDSRQKQAYTFKNNPFISVRY